MQWDKLLSDYRLFAPSSPEPSVRSEFRRDCDRIIFSPSFRRLKDKTQVFPLEKNAFVRTRITHSLEVSCVGKSLGSSAGQFLCKKYPKLAQKISFSEIGDIVEAACLAHDLGNPPFGHDGEEAMRDFFRSTDGQSVLDKLEINSKDRQDLENIEGNALGFRICTRLESSDIAGGLRLTAATIGTTVKYPCFAADNFDAANQKKIYKKNGIYQDDKENFQTIFDALEIPEIAPNCRLRHPLSFLSEAADDICYLIADLEDAYQVGQVSFSTASAILNELAKDFINPEIIKEINSKSDYLAYLRAKAIGKIVFETLQVFQEKEEELLAGKSKTPLLAEINSAKTLQDLREYSVKNIYSCRSVLEIQVAGYEILFGLIKIFCNAIAEISCRGEQASVREQMIFQLLPERFRRNADTNYRRILAVCDYISGMTDSYAVSLYKKLTGISLAAN
ncbi:MAG: dNTP triphosphohydrolase [Cardiobacteriaceae bacterium]|nr:dNTP triphosphohydrolase [Cardiobacteriaceae bacterium]